MAVRAPNGTPSNPNPDNLIPVRLLPNAGGGYGYGITRARDLPEGYERTINMLCHEGQLITPSFLPTRMAAVPLFREPPQALIPWEDSSSNPGVLLLGNRDATTVSDDGLAAFLQNGAYTAETISAGPDAFGNADFWDDGAGTAQLIAATKEGSKFLQTRNKAATWADGTQTGIMVVRAGDKFYAAANDYQVKQWATGTNPATAAASATYQVGTSESAITALGGIGSSLIAAKENGLWFFEDAEQRFVQRYKVDFHPDNFPFMASDGQGGLFTATAFGEVVHISAYGTITTYDLLRGKTPGRDTPRGPIKDIAVRGNKVYALMGGAYRMTQPGMKVLKTVNNGAAFTNYSSEVADGSLATVADISALDTVANGDWLLVGFDDQFLAMQFLMNAFNTTDLTGIWSYSTGAGTWANAGEVDGTAGVVNAGDFSYPFYQNGVVALPLGVSLSAWVTATYNSLAKYWLRFEASGAALDAATKIGELYAVVKRAAPSFSVSAAIGSTEVWEASGMLPKIIVGTLRGDSIVWDDVWTLQGVGAAGKLAVTALPMANAPAASLVAALTDYVLQFPVSSTPPHMAPYPSLARDVANQIPPVFYPSAVDLGSGYFKLEYIECRGRNFTMGSDKWRAAFRWDDTNAWVVLDDLAQEYAVFRVGENKGSVLHTAFQILDSVATDPVGPTGHEIIAWVRPLDDAPGSHNAPARTTPEVG